MREIPTPEKIPISALQHWLYCPRQCALIHLQQAWAETNSPPKDASCTKTPSTVGMYRENHIRITRGMAVASEKLALTGQCDS